MVTSEKARELALALPDALEQDHHGRPSYRVRGKMFATQSDAEHLNVMLDEGGVRTAVHDAPDACETQLAIEYEFQGKRIKTPLRETWIREGTDWWYVQK